MAAITNCQKCKTGVLEATLKLYLDDVVYDTETFRILKYKLARVHAPVSEGSTVTEFISAELGDSLAEITVSCENCGRDA